MKEFILIFQLSFPNPNPGIAQFEIPYPDEASCEARRTELVERYNHKRGFVVVHSECKPGD